MRQAGLTGDGTMGWDWGAQPLGLRCAIRDRNINSEYGVLLCDWVLDEGAGNPIIRSEVPTFKSPGPVISRRTFVQMRLAGHGVGL
jgi:hypothetical protein